MPAKSAAVKKPVSKTVKAIAKKPVTKPANKNAKAAAPVKKTVAKPVAKTPAKKPVAKAVAKPVVKPVAKKKPVVAAKPIVKSATKPVAKTVTKPVAKAPAAKTATKSTKAAQQADMSVDEAVARVMGMAAKKEAAKAATAKTAQAKTAVKAPAKTEADVSNAAMSMVATAKTAVKTAAAKPAKNDNVVLDYKAGDMVVYPAHGVGQVDGIETLTIGGLEVTLYTITFAKDRMRLKLPLHKIKTSGLRPLSTKDQMQAALQTMRGRARIKRVMWSRRAQEYEAKINSGSPVQVAEVLRDLRRNATGAENSYSERQIFQAALERLASELAAIEKIGESDAAQKLQNVLTEAA